MKGFYFFASSDGSDFPTDFSNYLSGRFDGSILDKSGNIRFVRNDGIQSDDGSFLFWYGIEPALTAFASDPDSAPPYGFCGLKFAYWASDISISRDGLWIFPVYYSFFNKGLAISNDPISIVTHRKFLWIAPVFSGQSLFESVVYKTSAPDVFPFEEILPLEFGTTRNFHSNGDGYVSGKIECPHVPAFWKGEGSLKDQPDIWFWKRKFKDSFQEVLSEIPDRTDVSVLFTGWLDSSLLLDGLHKQGKKNISAITVVQKGNPKEDDAMAKKFCESHGIRHYVIELDESALQDLPLTYSISGEPDSVLSWLSISLRKACEFARNEWIVTLLSGSYVEPLLGSNPSTLMTMKLLYSDNHPFPSSLFNSFSEDYRKLGIDYPAFAKSKVSLKDDAFFRMISKKLKKIFLSELDRFPIPMEKVFDPDFLKKIEIDRNVFPDYYLKELGELTLFDALTYSDLVFRWNVRNNLINQRISQGENVSIIPVFAHRKLRDIFLSLPILEKFDPSKYETTFSDNKYFIFQALKDVIPTENVQRKKTEASVPDFSIWLYSKSNEAFVRSVFSSVGSFGIFDAEYVKTLIRIYEIRMRAPGFKLSSVAWTDRAYDNAVWKMISLGIWLRNDWFPRFD